MKTNQPGRRSLPVTVEADLIRVGPRFAVSFQRTLRIPDDGRTYPLPPGLGRLPIGRVAELGHRAPLGWWPGDAFIPLYQREALWLAFDGALWKPNAVQVAVGGINAVSGGPWEEGLSANPQNYLVCPLQPWLDGINAGDGIIRQFVAMPLGRGYTVEAQVTGEERVGGIQIRVYEPKPGRFPDRPPPRPPIAAVMAPPSPSLMGLGAGGAMRQKMYPDPHGLDTWDTEHWGEIRVHIVNSQQYTELTGRPVPPTPVDPLAYTEAGLPWFDVYDERAGDIPAPEPLTEVKSIRESERERDAEGPGEKPPLPIDPNQVRKLHLEDGE